MFLDISDRVAFLSGAGLTSVAFHPDYPTDGRIFVSYTMESVILYNRVRRVVASYTSSNDGLSFEAASEQIVLAYDSRGLLTLSAWWISGRTAISTLALVAVGAQRGQDTYAFTNSFIRLDVDSAVPYAIPPDNPYVDGGGAPEVYAKGVRNPFRWSFDDRGNLWAADVGTLYIEEVNLITAGSNYGYPVVEGDRCLEEEFCDTTGMTGPIAGYDRDRVTEGASAILGGRIYRGSAVPSLYGAYVFSDFVTGTLRAAFDNGDGTYTTEIVGENARANHIAEDANGEFYFIRNTEIRRLILPVDDGPVAFPQTVSAIGCFEPIDPRLAGPAMIPYDLNVPLWSTAQKSNAGCSAQRLDYPAR